MIATIIILRYGTSKWKVFLLTSPHSDNNASPPCHSTNLLLWQVCIPVLVGGPALFFGLSPSSCKSHTWLNDLENRICRHLLVWLCLLFSRIIPAVVVSRLQWLKEPDKIFAYCYTSESKCFESENKPNPYIKDVADFGKMHTFAPVLCQSVW